MIFLGPDKFIEESTDVGLKIGEWLSEFCFVIEG